MWAQSYMCRTPAKPGFLSIDDLVTDQGELAIRFEFDHQTQTTAIEACATLVPDTKPADIVVAYFMLCDSDSPSFDSYFLSDTRLKDNQQKLQPKSTVYTILGARTLLAIFAGKKYKPVALKVWPVETELPSRFRITWEIKGNPLKDMPALATCPPPFQATGRYTEEQKQVIDQAHEGNFLLPEERALMHHFMSIQNEGFAWSDKEHGHFREDFFPPIEIPTILHKPWAQRNIPILPGIYEEVCWMIKLKIEARVYEPLNSSYHS